MEQIGKSMIALVAVAVTMTLEQVDQEHMTMGVICNMIEAGTWSAAPIKLQV